MAEYNITTPTGFFNSTIAPVFSENIFSAENLSEEGQKPDLTPITTIRQQIDTAANDGDISSLQFDAASSLARQQLLSNITSQDTYTRGKRDLEFNINAERDIQFNQGQQLLRDLDTYITASRATVVQREYEEKLKEEEKKLEEQKKEELQLMAMKLGIDPNGLSRKDLRKSISAEVAKQYKDKLSTDRMGKGGSSSKCQNGYVFNEILGTCVPNYSTNDIYTVAQVIANEANGIRMDASGNFISSAKGGTSLSPSQTQQYIAGGLSKYGIFTAPGTTGYNASYFGSGQAVPKASSSGFSPITIGDGLIE